MFDPEYLSSILDYNPDTGIVCWKSRPRTDFKYARYHTAWNKKNAGTQITQLNPSSGKIVCRIDNKSYSVDQLVYHMVTKEHHQTIYHINGWNADNRWSNLSPTSPGKKPAKYEGGDLKLTQNEQGIYVISSHGYPINFYINLREARTALMEFAEVFQVGWENTIPPKP